VRQRGPGKANGEERTEIVEHVLEEKEESELREHGLPRRERHLPSAHAKGLSDGMEEEDLRQTGVFQSTSRSTKWIKWRAYGWPLNGEVRKEDTLRTLPLLFWRRYLVGLQLPLAKVWDCINDNPRYTATEIDGLSKQKGSVYGLESMKHQ
jgi:hypothetical protein